MARRLLSLAVTVDQYESGDYYWRILESFDHLAEFESLLESVPHYATYADALKAGCAALIAMCDDPLVGPLEQEEPDEPGAERDW